MWSTLTTTKESVSDNPGRLIELGSSRARDWNDGWSVFTHSALHGAGAAGYATARLRYSTSIFRVDHAHSYIAPDARRLRPARDRRQPRAADRLVGSPSGRPCAPAGDPANQRDAPERIGLADAAVRRRRVRRSLDDRLDMVHPGHRAAGAPVRRLARRPRPARCARRAARRAGQARRCDRRLGLACTAPRRADAARRVGDLAAAAAPTTPTGAVLTALTRGDTAAAFTDARDAAARDPVSVQPLWLLAELYSRIGDEHAAHAELVKAIIAAAGQPGDVAAARPLRRPARTAAQGRRRARARPAARPRLGPDRSGDRAGEGGARGDQGLTSQVARVKRVKT